MVCSTRARECVKRILTIFIRKRGGIDMRGYINNSRSNKEARTLRNREEETIFLLPITQSDRGGTCAICGERITMEEARGGRYAVHVSLPNQKRGVWCDTRHNNHDLLPYTTEDYKQVGTARRDGLQFGIELEVNESCEDIPLEARAYLQTNGFLPTSDCTVGGEFKSPIYHSASSFAKVASAIEELNNKRYFWNDRTFSTRTSGTSCHLNISTPFVRNDSNYSWIRENKRALFEKLNNYIFDNMNDDEREDLFGRASSSQWACDMRAHDFNANVHGAFVNTELKSHNLLEFRLCKFINANQYIRLVRVFSEVVLTFDKHGRSTNGDDVLNAFIDAMHKYS